MDAYKYFENEMNTVKELEQKQTEGIEIIEELYKYVNTLNEEREKEYISSDFETYEDFLRASITTFGQQLERLTSELVERLEWNVYVEQDSLETFLENDSKGDTTISLLDQKLVKVRESDITEHDFFSFQIRHFEVRDKFVRYGCALIAMCGFAKSIQEYMVTTTLEDREKEIAKQNHFSPMQVKQYIIKEHIEEVFKEELSTERMKKSVRNNLKKLKEKRNI